MRVSTSDLRCASRVDGYIVTHDRTSDKVRFDGKNEDQFRPRAARARSTASARTPLHRQLEQALREAIRDGRLPGHDRAALDPRARAQLGVSRGIVVEAYEQLVAEGYLASRRAARRASPATPRSPSRPPPDRPSPRRSSSTSGPAARTSSEFPRAVWLRSLRRVLTDAPSERLTYLGRPRHPGAARRARHVPQPGPRRLPPIRPTS